MNIDPSTRTDAQALIDQAVDAVAVGLPVRRLVGELAGLDASRLGAGTVGSAVLAQRLVGSPRVWMDELSLRRASRQVGSCLSEQFPWEPHRSAVSSNRLVCRDHGRCDSATRCLWSGAQELMDAWGYATAFGPVDPWWLAGKMTSPEPQAAIRGLWRGVAVFTMSRFRLGTRPVPVEVAEPLRHVTASR